jgi:putative ABC transport system permease protein
MLLAGREIRRARLRFGLLAGAIGLLIFLVFFQQTLLSSLLNSFTGALQNQSGTVLVYSAEARKSLEGSVVGPDTVAQVAAVDGVAEAGPLGEATLTFVANGAQVDVAVLGAEPGKPGQPTKLVEGRLATGPGEGVASSEDRAKGFAIGDTVTTAAGGSPVTIVGLTKQSQFSVQPTLFVTFDTYATLRKATNPDATSVPPSAVAVIPEAGVAPRTVADAINASVPGVEAMTRSEAVASAPGVSSVQSSFAIVLALAVAVVALVTGFFFLILTVQKTASLTLLHAVGAPASYLVRGLLAQVALVLGTALVVAVGLLLVATAGAGSGLALTIEPKALVTSTVIIVVLSLIGVGFSVWRVLRIDPVHAVTGPGLGGLE